MFDNLIWNNYDDIYCI